MKNEVVHLIECFRSFQGEGPDCGRAMYILRFKTCNLKCFYCDTRVKMRISVEAPYKIEDIQKLITENQASILISGGEPTVSKHINETVLLLNKLNYDLANVETNGFQLKKLIELAPASKNIKYMYSPKIFSANDKLSAIELTEELLSKYNNVYIKAVYEENNQWLVGYLEWLSELSEYNQRVYLMVEGTNRADLIRNSGKVFDACEKYKFNFSSRTHIIYGFI